jgi:hypothetical protein
VRLKIVNFSSSSAPHPVDSSLLLDAINYLKEQAKADIVNMSLSSAQPVDGATQGIRNNWSLLLSSLRATSRPGSTSECEGPTLRRRGDA